MAHALHCLGLALAGWGNRHHEDRIDYLRDRLAQEEIDEAGGVIRLSPARSKTLVRRILPISQPIAEALARRRARRDPDSPLAFHRAGTPVRPPPDVLQLSKSGKRAIGRVGQAPSHTATPNKLLMN